MCGECGGPFKRRYWNLKNKLKEFQQGKIDIDGELIHAVINKIIVLDDGEAVRNRNS